MTFRDYQQITEVETKLSVLLYLSSNTQINEGIIREEQINEGIKEWLKTIGITIDKGPSIIDYAMNFTSKAGMIILAAIQGDKEKIKAIVNTFSKDAFVDFLIALDDITLGIISGPLDLVSALTGWDIHSSIKSVGNKTKQAVKNIQAGIQTVKTNISKIMNPEKQKIININLDNIEKSIPDVSAIKF